MPTAASAQGDALCVLAALFYASYDLRLFHWGKKVAPLSLSLSLTLSLTLTPTPTLTPYLTLTLT